MRSERFTGLTGVALPLQLAGMGVIGTPALARAVALAGGLGMISGAGLGIAEIDSAFDELSDVDGVVGVNFLVPFLDLSVLARAAARAPVCELFYGWPDRAIIEQIHAGGALAAWQVGSIEEASAAQEAGCDFVVVQGIEGGGHIRGAEALATLIFQARATLSVPIVAAGGIGNVSAVEAALDAGADAVRIGTRFVAAEESIAHPAYVDALVGSRPEDTVLTTTFTLGWPDAPHRVLRSCVQAAEQSDAESVGELSVGPDRFPVARLSTMPPTSSVTGHIEAMALYAGESVGSVSGRQGAADIVRELTAGL
jgi:nitronate monooxygenase